MKTTPLLLTIAATLGMTALTMAQNVPSYVPSNGLVGWWPFNGNANDESGNGNNLTNINNVNFSSDRFGNLNSCSNFSQTNQKFVISYPNLPAGNSNRTYSIWYNTDNNQLYMGTLYEQGQYPYSCQTGFGLYGNTNGCYFASTCVDRSWNNNESWINNWINITLTFESNTIKCYKNGILINDMSNPNYYNLSLNTSTFALHIGAPAANDQWTTTFIGQIDDFGIWNRALTQEEITALYTATPTNGGGGNNITASAVPQGISYQAVARNPQGQPLSNTALQVKFSLLADSLTGTVEYSELHSLTTNDLGLFSTAFGTGTPLSGSFANINWAGGNKYLKVEMDAGNGFVDLGTQQLLSVPYSMRSYTAAKAATIENASLPVYSDNAAALAGGLVVGQMYRTTTGDLKIVY